MDAAITVVDILKIFIFVFLWYGVLRDEADIVAV